MVQVLLEEKDVPCDRILTPWAVSKIVSLGKVNTLYSTVVHLGSNNGQV